MSQLNPRTKVPQSTSPWHGCKLWFFASVAVGVAAVVVVAVAAAAAAVSSDAPLLGLASSNTSTM